MSWIVTEDRNRRGEASNRNVFRFNGFSVLICISVFICHGPVQTSTTTTGSEEEVLRTDQVAIGYSIHEKVGKQN